MKDFWSEVAEAKDELEISMANFNQAVDKDVIDYWTYRILSAQTKYDHLMKEMRKENNEEKAAV